MTDRAYLGVALCTESLPVGRDAVQPHHTGITENPSEYC